MIGSQANSAYTRLAESAATSIVPFRGSPKRVTICEPVRGWRDPVMERMKQLVQLERGWDGYRGAPVGFDIAHFALRMLDAACGVDAPTPQLVPGSDGDLQIEWHTERGDIELDVRAPNDVLAWRRTASTGPDGEEVALTNDFSLVASWIAELLEPSCATGTAAA